MKISLHYENNDIIGYTTFPILEDAVEITPTEFAQIELKVRMEGRISKDEIDSLKRSK